jgi:hypothetical protein
MSLPRYANDIFAFLDAAVIATTLTFSKMSSGGSTTAVRNIILGRHHLGSNQGCNTSFTPHETACTSLFFMSQMVLNCTWE